MKILVMGAGAVGAYFGARLRASGEDVVLCARGENLRAIREHGLDITSIRGDLRIEVTATDTPRDFAPYDLILFCVKAYDTDAAASAISGCLKPGGAILTLQNGVENEAKLAAIFGRDAVMGGNARVGVEMVAPGKIVHLSTGHIDFGELDGRETDRARKIAGCISTRRNSRPGLGRHHERAMGQADLEWRPQHGDDADADGASAKFSTTPKA